MRATSWIFTLALFGVTACGPSLPVFPPVGRDAGLECGDEASGLGSCGAGQVCLQGRCFSQCDGAHPCGPLETCSPAGVCVAGVRDAGAPVDAGPGDPCAAVECPAERPFCRGGACLECQTRDECGGGTPICDVGRGICVSFVAAEVCAPCNGDSDCRGGASTLRCLPRSDVSERVCLLECPAEGCPAGFVCDTTAMLCVPVLGGTCAALRAGPCDGDAACAPAGASTSDGLVVGACFDPAGGDARTCHARCTAEAPCANGRACDEGLGFCL